MNAEKLKQLQEQVRIGGKVSFKFLQILNQDFEIRLNHAIMETNNLRS